MNIDIPFLHNKRQFRLTADDIVELTSKGKEAADSQAFSGSRAQILMALDEGATSIKELSNDVRLPIDKVKATIANLMHRAEVRKVGYEG